MIEMKDIRFAYPKRSPLFDALDFVVQPGGVVGLLGKNGAGKTTLLKIGAGLLFAQGGEAALFGKPAFTRDPAILARIAYVPEQFEVPTIRLREFIAYHAPYYPRFDHDLMEQYLQRFEIVGNDKMSELSYGQQKKVLLSFALAGMAELVILDEPTNGLDIPSKQVFRRLIAEAADDQRAVIISTHQVRDVENLIDPIVVLDNGAVVFEAAMGAVQEGLEMRRFHSEVDARGAGALAVDSHLGSSVALVPRASHNADAPAGSPGGASAGVPAGEPLGDNIDLELLFQAAIEKPEEMRRWCGGAA